MKNTLLFHAYFICQHSILLIMSNLYPVARVDKNGRVVTRHMKIDGNDHHISALPPVALSASGMEIKELFDRNLLELVYGNEDSDLLFETNAPGLELLKELRNEECLEDIATLLQSDSEAGNQELRRVAREAISKATEASLYDRESSRFDSMVFDDGGCYYTDFKRAWAVADVNGALGRTELTPEYYKKFQIDMDKLRNSITYHGRNMLPPTPQYWRGMTALYESNINDFPTEESRTEARDFVKWAGEQQEIALIIDAARSRGTLNVDTLRSVVNIGKDVPALIDGAL